MDKPNPFLRSSGRAAPASRRTLGLPGIGGWAHHGFTLIELVATMVIIGVLAVVAVGRLDFASTFEQKGVQDKLKAALQYARKAAVAHRRYVCVSTANGTVTFTIDGAVPENTATSFGGNCPFGNALNLIGHDKDCPTGVNNAVCSRSGATIASNRASFQFDARGAASTSATFTVTGQPGVTVEAGSGYVH